MEARAGNSILEFETLFSDFQELLNGSGLRSEDPLLLVPLVPHTPTCPNLSYLVVPLVLSKLSFSHCHSIFRNTLLTENFSSKYYHVGEGKQQANFDERTGDNRDHTLEHMDIFCLESNPSDDDCFLLL